MAEMANVNMVPMANIIRPILLNRPWNNASVEKLNRHGVGHSFLHFEPMISFFRQTEAVL